MKSMFACVLFLACAQAGVVIDFQSLEIPGTGYTYIGAPGTVYQEDGFQLAQGVGESFAFARMALSEARYPGSTALFNDSIGGAIILTKIGGGTFDLTSIDFACLNNAQCGATVNLVGTKADASIVNASFGPILTLNSLTTFNLPGTFTGLVSVSWTQASPFHQFDNIVLDGANQAVPEPTSLALTASGILAAWALRRRRS